MFSNRIIEVAVVTSVVVDLPGQGQPEHLGPGASPPPRHGHLAHRCTQGSLDPWTIGPKYACKLDQVSHDFTLTPTQYTLIYIMICDSKVVPKPIISIQEMFYIIILP